MARRTVSTCDFPGSNGGVCGSEATARFEGSVVGSRLFAGDFCEHHRLQLESVLVSMGVTPTAAVTHDHKMRQVHVAKSGATFSTADARKWLFDRGAIASMHGRISTENLELYAEAH